MTSSLMSSRPQSCVDFLSREIADDLGNLLHSHFRLSSADPDESLVGEVRRALTGTGRSALQSLDVAADRGRVTLCGRVPTYYMKQLAQQAVMAVEGVHRVDNQLDVE